MPVTLDIWEIEMWRIMDQGHLEQIVDEVLSPKLPEQSGSEL
jgi:hypothetical protein